MGASPISDASCGVSDCDREKYWSHNHLCTNPLCRRKKLGLMVRHWSIYFLGVAKHGWDDEVGEIKTEVRRPQNFLLDPDGFVDEYGDFVGAWLGERIRAFD